MEDAGGIEGDNGGVPEKASEEAKMKWGNGKSDYLRRLVLEGTEQAPEPGKDGLKNDHELPTDPL